MLEEMRKGKFGPVLQDEEFTKQSRGKPSGGQQGRDWVVWEPVVVRAREAQPPS